MGRLAEVGIDERWRIEWIPGSWMADWCVKVL